MTRRPRRRASPFRIALLVIAIGVLLYINQVVVPATPPLFIPTATPTRSPESFVSLAEDLYRQGKIAQAMEAYSDAIVADAENSANYITLARLQAFSGMYDEAIENARNALLMNANNAQAYAVEGWALGFKGDYLEAEAALKKALEIDPNSALAHAYYAEILVDKGDFEELDKAAEHSRLARDIDPNSLEVHRARGLVLLASGSENLAEAISEFKAAIAINDKIADLHLNLGYAYQLQEENSLAIEELLTAYTLNPKDGSPLIEAARVYSKDGQYGKATQHAEQAVKTNPANARWHAFLGTMYYRNQELDKAIQALELGIRGGTTADGVAVEGLPLEYGTVADYYTVYGFSLAKSSRCIEAVPIFQAMLTALNDDETAVYNATEGIGMCLGGTPTPESGEAGAESTEAVEGEAAAEGEATPSP